ncbi:MAG: hypothetical protein AB7O26_07580 [Planctomycetaceae bacterium]
MSSITRLAFVRSAIFLCCAVLSSVMPIEAANGYRPPSEASWGRAFRLQSERDGHVKLGKPQRTPPGKQVLIPKRSTVTAEKKPSGDSPPSTRESARPSAASKFESGPTLEGPVLGLPEKPANSSVKMDIRFPSRCQVGAEVTFELTLLNETDSPIDEVAIESEFDAALKFPGSERTRVRQKLGRLAAGEERRLALTLVGDKEGMGCSRFVVTSRGAELVWKSVCVDISSTKAGLKLLGPKVRYVGDRAEFTAKIVNTSAQSWKKVEVVCSHPGGLEPREASTGARQSEGALNWMLGDLEPGEGVQLQVEFECTAAVAHGGVAMLARAENGVLERVEEFVVVSTPTSPLSVRVSDGNDLIGVGEETEYLVELSNSAKSAVRVEGLEMDVPQFLQVVSADLQPSGSRSGAVPEVLQQRILLPEGLEIPPSGTAMVRVRVKATGAGDGVFLVRYQGLDRNSTGPSELDEPTTVNR